MNVPKLRFGEFFANKWNNKQLVNICDMRAGKFVRASEINGDFDEGLYPCYGGNGLRGFTKSFTHEGKHSLIGRQGALCGNVTLAINKFHATEHAVVVSASEGVSTDWLFYALGRLNLNQYATGQAQPGLSVENLEKVELSISDSEKEQQKIADFLSAVDEKITALTAQKNALTQYKQGMMQRIFAQTLRFKDDNGADYPEWEEYMIGDVFKVTRGQVLASSETSETVNSNYIYPVYSSQTKNNGLMGYFNDYLYQDAITWTTDGANAGDVNFRSGRFYCTNVCGVLISENGFANQCVSEILNKITHRYVSYVGNPKLMNNVMSNIVINLPSSIEEQTKIARFLTECDDKINAVDAQIQSAQQWKQGLLQQMFV